MTVQTKNIAPAVIHRLVETFEQNLDSYRSSKNETELRREFLDKFFTALGWDVANEKGYDELGKEVIHEFSVDVAGQQKKADYAFRVGRGEKFDFLVEAKKPSVKIESSQEAAFQIRRYGWSAKLSINILSDFEHFAVYDCRAKPSYNDKASMGRIMLIHYKEYAERWDEIVEIFSPEAVRQGSFAKYADGMKGKRGTADVDDAFLQEIERWRELLAKNIALRNEDIDIAGLNYAVQMTIDRIVFLRICEERGIEPENQLLDITLTPSPSPSGRGGIYEELCELFKRADTKYNSGLFHFKKEKEMVSRPDDLTLTLDIDDKVLKDIISNLYYPKSPYAFLYIPSDILGQVYERFLGKVIRLTAGHQAKVEEKPEVRKAGGVYYTPTYIVDYIVKNTVGKLLSPLPLGEGRVREITPREVENLRIVDPACGSGTFLLGAYQFLLDWHLNWYAEHDAEKWEKNKAIVKAEGGYRLTTIKKKEILLNNIHGVDIDAQAVEVTKLSLLLKVLENASGQLGLGLERVLPDLGNNIKCGNSLIGFDYFEGQLFPDEEERARVNPFDWKREFPQVFQQTSEVPKTSEVSGRGGFDVVIGNPPYGIVFDDDSKPYLENRFPAFVRNNDTYTAFVEKSLSLLRQNGVFGFIIPNTYLLGPYFDTLKTNILSQARVSEIIDFGTIQIFQKPNVFTGLLFFEKGYLSKQSEAQTRFAKIKDIQSFPQKTFFDILDASALNTLRWSPMNLLVVRLLSIDTKLESFAWVKDVGLNYWTQGRGKTRGGSIADRVLYDGEKQHSHDRPYLKGRDIDRYSIAFGNHWLRHDYQKRLDPKADTLRFSPNFLEREKITYRQTADHIIASLDLSNMLTDKTAHVIVLRDEWTTKINLRYFLGILNSRLLTYLYKATSQEEGRTFAQVKTFRMKELPIHSPNFSNPAEKATHDKMVSLVEQMLAGHKSLAAAKSPQEKERLERQIEVTDRAIDSLVYELYGLTDEEKTIVEESLSKK